MFGGFFGWVRAGVKNAALAGLADAAVEIAGENGDQGEAVIRLRALLTPALPAPEAETVGTSRRRKE